MEVTKRELEVAGCFRRLMKAKFLLRSRNEKWFQTLIDLRGEVDQVAKKLLLDLEINESLGVAFLRPLSDEIEESVSFQVGKKKTLSPLSSALAFKIRYERLQFFLNPINDVFPIISIEAMRDFLQNLSTAKIDSQFERSFRRSIDELVELQLLQETKTDSGIFEITALCEILLPLDQMQELKAKMELYFGQTSSVGVEDVR